MKGVLVGDNGTITLINCSDTTVIRQLLGGRPIELFSTEMNCALTLHEMGQVLEMPANVIMTELSQELLFGPVLACPSPDSRYHKYLLSREFAREAQSKNSDIAMKKYINEYYRTHGGRQRFSPDGGDRWFYNGKAFGGIVVVEADDHKVDGIDRYFAWMFGDNQNKPETVRICEFSLGEVMKMLIRADEETAAGNPPPEFQSVAQKLGLWTSSG